MDGRNSGFPAFFLPVDIYNMANNNPFINNKQGLGIHPKWLGMGSSEASTVVVLQTDKQIENIGI